MPHPTPALRAGLLAATTLCACVALLACSGSLTPVGWQQVASAAGNSGSQDDPATPCIRIHGLPVDADAAELARSLVAAQLQSAARRGAGRHPGATAGELITKIDRSTGSLDMAFRGYVDAGATYDGALWARVPPSGMGRFGGELQISGRVDGDLRLCAPLGRALVAAALGEEEDRPPDVPETVELDDGRQPGPASSP